MLHDMVKSAGATGLRALICQYLRLSTRAIKPACKKSNATKEEEETPLVESVGN